MDYQERKWKDGIREALILMEQAKVKATGNPYASLQEEPDHKELNTDSTFIYNYLNNKGLIK